MRSLLPFVSAAAFALWCGSAHAVERQHHIGIDVGMSLLSVDNDNTPVGIPIGVHYTYGLTDAWNFMAEGGVSPFLARAKVDPDPKIRPGMLSKVAVGAGYTLDAIEFVPYAGVLAVGYVLSGDSLSKPVFAFGGALALGVDWQIARNFGIGVTFREHLLLTKMTQYPTFTEFGLRAEFVWGY